jgi:peptidoglycan/LPS O-acetylase OafA/YrhL
MTATWSLAVEEQFYLTVPYLIRKVQPRNLLVVLIVIIVGAPFLRMLLHAHLANGDFACYVLTPCRADALCMGVLAALLVRNARCWTLLVAYRRALYLMTALLLVGVAYMTYRGYQPFAPPMNIWGYSWLALFYTGSLLIAVTSPRNARGLLCSSWLTNMGTIAYCSYLIHFPLIYAGRRLAAAYVHGSPNLSWLVGGLIGIGATLSLAAISWKLFEKPLLRRGHLYSY